MPNGISTGYKPEFALGALYQGMNAANQNMSAEEELIKQFLANQRELQTQPIDVAQKQQNLESEAYKTSPEYQTGMRNTIFGQGKSNLAAGELAQALQPFKEKAGRRGLETEFQQQDMLNQLYQIDQALASEQNPLTRMAYTKERSRIADALKNSPEFLRQKELKEIGGDISAYLADLRAKSEAEKARAKAEAPPKPANMSVEEAAMRRRIAENPEDAVAKRWLDDFERSKRVTTPGMGAVGYNPRTGKLEIIGNIVQENESPPTREGILNGRSQTKQEPALPVAGWTMK